MEMNSEEYKERREEVIGLQKAAVYEANELFYVTMLLLSLMLYHLLLALSFFI